MLTVVTRDAEFEILAPDAEHIDYPELGGAAYALKGVFDRIAGSVLLLLAAVPMLVLAAFVKLSSPGPALVKQVRVGRFGRPFTTYKFRSMREDAELMRDDLEDRNSHDAPTIFKMRRDPRTTPVGRFIRRTSLDELPQLWSVVRGDMSLVGPRPPLPREVMHYEARHLQRLAATPGMTGLWQVRGRSEIPFEQMVAMDVEYIRTWSLWLDLRILLKTPLAVVGGRGAW